MLRRIQKSMKAKEVIDFVLSEDFLDDVDLQLQKMLKDKLNLFRLRKFSATRIQIYTLLEMLEPQKKI